MDRSICGQRVFGGCPGESCDRQCSATIWIPPSETTLGRHLLRSCQDYLLIAFVTLFSIMCLGAAVVAMPRNLKTWEVAHAPV